MCDDPLRAENPNAESSGQGSKRGRAPGIDALRIVLAAIVMLGHFGVFPIAGLTIGPASKTLIRSPLESMCNGQAAVIAFFLISGFCIHSAYANVPRVDFWTYILRREIRILAPVIAAFALGSLLHSLLFSTILWSLVCEEIYYLLYPGVLTLRRRFGWPPIFGVAAIGSGLVLIYGMALRNPSHAFHDLGYGLTWILGYPIWLCGCLLAESAPSWSAWTSAKHSVWIGRLGIWSLSVACLMLRFHPHGGITNELLMMIFAVPCFFWLKNEIRFFQAHPPLDCLERLGKGSYSLYLVHLIGPALLGLSLATVRGGFLPWIQAIVAGVALATAFYFVIERPSHRLARTFSR